MDRILPYPAQPNFGQDDAKHHLTGVRHTPLAPGHLADTYPPKSASDYIRAVRQRIWLVLIVAVPVGVIGTILILRMAPVYQARGTLTIEPPSQDPIVAGLIATDYHPQDGEEKVKYLPNEIGILRSAELANAVLAEPGIVYPPGGDPAQELANSVGTKHFPGSNRVEITMDGPDPARVAKTLHTWLIVFQRQAIREHDRKIQDAKSVAEESHKVTVAKLADLDTRIQLALIGSTTIGPGGRSLLEGRFETSNMVLMQKRVQFDNLQREARAAQIFPSQRGLGSSGDARAESKIAELEERLRQLDMRRDQQVRVMRPGLMPIDPATRAADAQANAILKQIATLRRRPELATGDPFDFFVQSAQQEIQSLEESQKELLNLYQSAAPNHQKFLGMLEERTDIRQSLVEAEKKLSSFEWLSRTPRDFIHIPDVIHPPVQPIKPNRPLYIAFSIVFGLISGIALVCMFEHMDQSVKVPEQLTVGLSLPLFGVIPRIRRTSEIQRGGHLWTAGAPGSVEADAYRNLRASLVGLQGPNGPLVTLLVTSAKAGEGKSTTALNLAATCARSGERTLLVDVDLRRPSLDPVFPDEDGLGLGLVDVLKDDLPWSRAVIRTDIGNLDFLPTGDTTKIPIEILGTREMRQLLASLAESHYDRVILDGPAILGLADCRMLGQMVDGALLVVRAGAMELQPLKRAKAMLEQSRVPIAGVVFNGLADDLQNWSSYGPEISGSSSVARLGSRRADVSALANANS